MGLWELFVLAVGLSMDAFSVAVCKGLSDQKKADSDRRTVFWIFSGIYAPGGISSGNWLPGKNPEH